MVGGGSCGNKPWCVKVVDICGTTFVRLDGHDHGLRRFIAGTSNTPLGSYVFAKELRNARNAACVRAAQGEEPLLDDDEQQETTVAQRWTKTRGLRKEFKHLKSQAEELGLDLVTMDLPRIADGVGPISVKTPLTLDKGAVVSVPADAAVLHYVREAFLARGIEPKTRSVGVVDTPKGCYYDDARRAIVAKRQRQTADDPVKWRVIKATPSSGLAAAKEEAEQWMQAEGDD